MFGERLHSDPMLSSSGLFTKRQVTIVRNAVFAVGVGFALTALVGFLLKSKPISSIDTDTFNWLVPKLQTSDFLVDFAELVTPVATIQVGRIGGLVIGIGAMLYHRHLVWLVLPPITMIGAQAFQNLMIDVVQRDNPIENVIGNSGGYFSGGVMRAMVLSGMVITAVWPQLGDRKTYAGAFVVGIVVASSRMILGRHWPLDVVSAFAVGFGIVAIFRMVLRGWTDGMTETGALKPGAS